MGLPTIERDRPADVEDMSQCVFIANKKVRVNTFLARPDPVKITRRVYIFCVECDDWYPVVAFQRLDMVFRQGGRVEVDLGPAPGDWEFQCANCREDIGYILERGSPGTETKLIDAILDKEDKWTLRIRRE